MKKVFCFIFLFVFMFSMVSSVSIETKDSYDLGETFIAEVKGNFIEDIGLADINFYRRHMQTSFENVFIESFENRTFIYFDISLDKVVDDYSVVISDVLHVKGAEESREDVFVNFSIVSDVVPFSVSPGVIYTEGIYDLEIKNYIEGEIEIKINPSSEAQDVENSEEGAGFFESLFGGDEEENETLDDEIETAYFDEGSFVVKEGEVGVISFEPSIKGWSSLILGYENTTYEIPVYSKEVVVVVEENDTEEENESVEENDTSVEENDTADEPVTIDEPSTPTCDELNGTTCNKTQKCNQKYVDSRGGNCCLGVCENVEESSLGKTIGWVIIIALAFFIAWFFKKKYRKPAEKIDLEKVAKGKKK